VTCPADVCEITNLRTGASSCVGVQEPVEIAFAAESMLESPRHIFGEDVPVVPGPYRDDCGLPELGSSVLSFSSASSHSSLEGAE
jgi:hypothetical protein